MTTKKANEEEKYGFVYIWRDRKHKRYYIGCHWGTEDDGYVCSSSWMTKAYKRRPNDFKRRILTTMVKSKKDLLQEEYNWLKQIKKHELKTRYYNVHNHLFGHWSNDPERAKEVLAAMSEAGKNISEETRQKMSDAKKGKRLSPDTEFKSGQTPWNVDVPQTDEVKEKLSKANVGKSHGPHSEETKKKISVKLKGKPATYGHKGKKHSQETKKIISNKKKGQEAWNKGLVGIMVSPMKGRTHSDESKEKNRLAHIGKSHSNETKDKISQRNKGRIFSEEHRQRLSIAAKQRYSKENLLLPKYPTIQTNEGSKNVIYCQNKWRKYSN